MAMIGMHAIVFGRVQGVFFRKYTQQQATTLGVNGWVRNKPDGTVEVEAHGEQRHVQALCDWLNEGSPASEVKRVELQQIEFVHHDHFDIK